MFNLILVHYGFIDRCFVSVHIHIFQTTNYSQFLDILLLRLVKIIKKIPKIKIQLPRFMHMKLDKLIVVGTVHYNNCIEKI